VLDAKVRTRKTGAKREIPLSEFFTGVGETILGKDELVTDIFVHKTLLHTGGAFLKVGKRNALFMSTASAASAITIEDNVIRSCRVALGGVASTPIRVKNTEELLIGEKATDARFADAAKAASDEVMPIASSHRHKRSTADYRTSVSGTLVKRTLQLARDRSLGRE